MFSVTYTIVFIVLSTAVLVKLFFKNSNKFCESKKSLNGKTCVVTGGTTGMGLEISKEFARRGAKVIIACPFEEEGRSAQKAIVNETGNKKVVFKNLNLGSLESTRQFAQDILNTEDRLDILINNAGIAPEPKLTADGLNITMQVNYYGHFLLTILLLPLLKKSGTPTEKSRIVNTTSPFHFMGSFKPNNMNNTRYLFFLQPYSDSKFCFLLFARELTKILKTDNVVINSVDPGYVGTAIYHKNLGSIFGSMLRICLYILVKTPWQGAQTALHVSLDDKINDISGEYFRNCELCRAKAIAYDDKAAKLLWDESARLVKLNESFM